MFAGSFGSLFSVVWATRRGRELPGLCALLRTSAGTMPIDTSNKMTTAMRAGRTRRSNITADESLATFIREKGEVRERTSRSAGLQARHFCGLRTLTKSFQFIRSDQLRDIFA